MNKKLVLLGASLLLTAATASAQKRVTGRVVDTDGQPVIGATIRVEGGKSVTLTDDNGNFTLQNVPASAKQLKITYIGMKEQHVSVAGNVKVVMAHDDQVLDEAMVVAFGTAKKSSFTGSAAQIKGEKIEQRITSNVSNALNGQLAGVQSFNTSGAPGEGASIRVRGFGSLNSSNAPLIVVDGMPYDGSLSSINPMDIESMSVLKDAAANAIYGARGANGVVLITTKQGRDKDAKITVDMKWGTNQRATPNYKTLGIQNYYETAYKALYNSKFYNGASEAQAHAFAQANLFNAQEGGVGYNVYTVPQGQQLIGTNFKLNPAATLGYSDGDYYYTPDDWYDEFFSGSNLRQEYNINVAGRSERMNYYASVGFLDDNGLIANSGFRRYTGRGRVDYQAKKWLRVGTNIDFSETQNHKNGNDGSWNSSANLFGITNLIAPIYPLYVRNADGSIAYEPATGTPLYDNGANSTNATRPFMSMARPGAIIANDRATSLVTTLNGKWYAELSPIEGLKLTANVSVMDRNSRTNELASRFGSSTAESDGEVAVSHSHTTGVNTQFLANYAFKVNTVHDFEVLAGYEQYSLRSQGLSGSNDHLYNPFIGELGNAGGTSKKQVSSSTNRYMTQGFLARVQYNYLNRYFLSGSFRRDASSRFYKDNRWGNFGSLGAAWLVSGEDFMSDVKWVDMLKLKASWGVQGNDVLLDGNGYVINQPYSDQYSVTYSEETGEYSKTMTWKGNKDLTWETSYSFNIGADFELLNGRINGSLEYFHRTTKDLLYNKPTPLSSGNTIGSIPMNVGEMVNQGIELDLTGYIIKQKDMDWSVNFNLTHLKNKITALDPDVEANGGIKGSYRIQRVGGSYYQMYLREYAGVDKETGKALFYKDVVENVLDENGNKTYDAKGQEVTKVVGRTTTDDYNKATQYDLGNPLPDVYGGFGTSFHWKGLDFSANFSYQLGGKVYDGTYQRLMHTGESSNMGTNWSVDILNAWTPDNKNSDIPRICASDKADQQNSSRWLTSSDYLSFNNVTLGYTFPKHWLSSLDITSLRVYVSGDNLGVISARKGFDPRMSVAGGSSYSQSSSANYSLMRNITAGVTLTF